MAEISQPKNQNVKLTTEIPGPLSQKIRAEEDKHLSPGLQGFALMSGIVVKEAIGSTVTDVDGNTFIDVIGGIGVNGLGHSHPKFVSAIQNQVSKASVGSFTSEPRVELFNRLAEHRPTSEIHRTQLYSGGAEAVESALRLAKNYTKKFEFISFWGGFHGKTMGSLSLMGSTFKESYGPMVPGSHMVPYANCYRCPLKLKHPECGLACVDLLRKHAKTATTGSVAAIIIEPMQGTAGNVIPPNDYLPAVKEVAKEIDALLICDEMITGVGRTGKYWGLDHSGVEPDIVTLGKQFGVGTSKASPEMIRHHSSKIMWSFLFVNILGYSTYYWYPAAPPWYVADYGLGPANMAALPSAAGCLRFDEILGTNLFSEMYGRSLDTFGAIPSLHIAYPLLSILFAFKLGALRIFSILFFILMLFSAVYLNHHYILDLIVGAIYTLIVYILINISARSWSKTKIKTNLPEATKYQESVHQSDSRCL